MLEQHGHRCVKKRLGEHGKSAKGGFRRAGGRGKKTFSESLPPLSSSRELCALIDGVLPEWEAQWADGIRAGATSAAYMLLVMKIICKDASEMWSVERVAEVSAVLGEGGSGELESAKAVRALDRIKDTMEGNDLKLRALARRRLLPRQQELRFKDLVQGVPEPIKPPKARPKRKGSGGGGPGLTLRGTPVSTGQLEGPVRVVKTLAEADQLVPGEILICPYTDVGWTPYFSLASGLVTEMGGLLSHGAVVAREYGLPCVVNVTGACSTLQTGDHILLDATAGVVTLT